jgi:hypothetical protein
MASDVGGYISTGGQSGQGEERRSFDEGDRKKVALGKRFANLNLWDTHTTESPPIALRLEPWGEIPEPPKERREYLKTLLGERHNGHGGGKLLGGDASHQIHHHENQGRSSSPAPSGLSRSSSLSRTLSRIGEKATPKISVNDCFKRFTSVETLDGDNKFACEECAKVLCSRLVLI